MPLKGVTADQVGFSAMTSVTPSRSLVIDHNINGINRNQRFLGAGRYRFLGIALSVLGRYLPTG
jgi:hypothetical protein